MKRFLIIFIILFSPTAAFAYLDPGTGGVLVNIIVASVAAAIYFIRELILRFFKKGGYVDNRKNGNYDEPQIAILSEGLQYWGTFKPIVDALIQNKHPFKYYTLDVNDPALTIENDLMHSQFLGYGPWSYTRVAHIEADTLLTTTPNIGTKGSPIRKPAGVNNLMHVFHSINDLSMYKTGSLDQYDSVILVGDFQIESIREIEKLRNLKKKELLPLGLPYLDGLVEEKRTEAHKEGMKTILVGSSWGSKGCLQSYGTEFIKQIARAGYHVIVRPHPQSYISEKELIKKCKNELSQIQNIEWDELISPSTSMSRADLLISDTSSVRFDFAFIYEKPVITLSINAGEMPGYERDYLSTIWTDKLSHEIGFVVERASIGQLSECIEKAFIEFDSSKICQIRNQTIHHFGESGVIIAKHFAEKKKNN